MSFSIRTRIALLIAAGLVTLAALIAVSLHQKAPLDRNIQRLASSMNKIEWVSDLQLTIEETLMPVSDFLIVGDAMAEETEFRQLAAEIEKLLGRIEDPDFLDEQERIILSRVRTDYERLKLAGEEIFAAGNPVGNPRSAALRERFDAMGADLVLYLEQFQSIHDERLKQILDETDSANREARRQLIASGVVAGVLAAVFGAWLAQSLILPIRELDRGMQHVAQGHWDHRVDIRTRDELEGLANHFNEMAEKLGSSYRSIENHAVNLATLLETSTEISAAREVQQLLDLVPARLTQLLRTTYCRIALMDGEHSNPIIRAAYPIRTMDWDPGIGRSLNPNKLPVLRKALETNRHVLLTKDEIRQPEYAAEREQLLTPDTQSALVLPLILNNKPQGAIILGEIRSWEREPFTSERIAVCQTMANQAAVAVANSVNYANLQEMALSTVTAMANAIDAKSPWTRGHSTRVAQYAVALGQKLGLADEVLDHLRLGCLLHDIGKIGINGTILCKTDQLTDDEMANMKQHTAMGESILRPIKYFGPILPVIRHHHEHYDGSGYPDGLKGEAIPILARIAAVADTFDAMVADRPYRRGCGRNEAIAEIRQCAGSQFDPSIAEVFAGMLEHADFGATLLAATTMEVLSETA